MTVVFARDNHRSKFHREQTCPQLLKAPPRGKTHALLELDVADIGSRRPCRSCFPDAPRIKVIHRRCPVCNPRVTRPCAHNGGVRVTMTRTRRKPSIYMDAGDTYARHDYVWPENALLLR